MNKRNDYLFFFGKTVLNFSFFSIKHILLLFEFLNSLLDLDCSLFGAIIVFSGVDKDVWDLFFLIIESGGLSDICFFAIFYYFGGVILPNLI